MVGRRSVLKATATALLAASSSFVNAQGSSKYDPSLTTCSRDFHQAIIVDSTLYVDGGELFDVYYFGNRPDSQLINTNPSIRRIQNQHLWKLDLTKKFNTLRPRWVTEEKPQSPDEHYNGADSTVWNMGNGVFYTVGGWFSLLEGPAPPHVFGAPYVVDEFYSLPDARIFAYDTKTSKWSNQRLEEGVDRISAAAYAESVTQQIGFAAGGIFINEEDDTGGEYLPAPVTSTWVNTMTLRNFTADSWETEALPRAIGFTQGAQMVSLERVGEKGALVFFGGGVRTPNETRSDFDTVWVYDIDGREWFSQATGGDETPVARTDTCSIVVPAPDGTSHQIYVFSGNSADGRLLDMWVLSVPAFEWIKVPLKNYPDEFRMSHHSCALFSNRQMVIVPGEKTTPLADDRTFNYTCEIDSPVHVFDTATWEFTEEFDPERKESLVPPAIVDLVGGSEKGKATLKEPRHGWDDAILGEIFAKINDNKPPAPPSDGDDDDKDDDDKPGSPSPSSGGSGSDPSGVPSDGEGESKPPLGAILGGVLGGLAALALILVGILYLLKRRRGPPAIDTAAAAAAAHPAVPAAEMPYSPYDAQAHHHAAAYGQQQLYDPPPQELASGGYPAVAEMGAGGVGGYYAPDANKNGSAVAVNDVAGSDAYWDGAQWVYPTPQGQPPVEGAQPQGQQQGQQGPQGWSS